MTAILRTLPTQPSVDLRLADEPTSLELAYAELIALLARMPAEPAAQVHLARWLMSACALIAVLASSVVAVPTRGRAVVVDRMANGKLARNEALGPPPAAVPPAPKPIPRTEWTPTTQPPNPTIPARRGAVPVGKGMWLYEPDHTEGGNPDGIVARAKATGLTHLYLRLGSSVDGFNARPFLDALLPAAHAAGIRVYGWDFPYLDNADGDVDRAVAAITYVTPSGHRIDGFVADIELRSMGVNISPATAAVYGAHLRQRVGPNYPLIACVPRPSPQLVNYPFNEVIEHFDAIAPMVYWLNREPVGDVVATLNSLSRYNKPVIPIGQAYDGAPEGGRPGVPGRDQLLAFSAAAEEHGAVGVSWWSWQHADQQAWDAVRDATQFQLPATSNGDNNLSAAQVRSYQTLLTSLGFSVPVTGAWDQPTADGLAAYQAAARLPADGLLDTRTRDLLLAPFAPPLPST